jgi:adenosylcobinamide-phosphate synthase
MPSAETALLILAVAVVMDLAIGEYPALLHPVVWMGKLIAILLRLAPAHGWWRQFLFGAVLAALTIALSVGLAVAALHLAARWPWLQVAVGAGLLKAAFALRELGRAAERVVAPLETGDIDTARTALRSLCSRDAERLEPADLLAGTVESLAENASDSVIAPLFYYLLLGVPGAVGYRAINTLDAMVGYRGRYEALGKVSARLDDVANWLPARLTALLFLGVGWLSRLKAANGWRIWRRDAARTPSPNGGRPMSVVAGLLGVRLDKPGVYVLGDAQQPLTPRHARLAWRLVFRSALTMFLLCAAVLAVRHYCGDAAAAREIALVFQAREHTP